MGNSKQTSSEDKPGFPAPKTMLVPSGPEPNAYEIQMPIPRPSKAQSNYVYENLFTEGPTRMADSVFPNSQIIIDQHTFALASNNHAPDSDLQTAPTIFSLDDLARLYAWGTLNDLIPHHQRSIMIRHTGVPEWKQVAIAITETPDGTTHILYAEAFEHFPISDEPCTSDVSLLSVSHSDVEEFFEITGNINRLRRAMYEVWHGASGCC